MRRRVGEQSGRFRLGMVRQLGTITRLIISTSLALVLLMPVSGWAPLVHAQEGTPDGGGAVATDEPVATEEIPTVEVTDVPTDIPTDIPTDVPTDIPTDEPPTLEPTTIPTDEPSATLEPTSTATETPTETPTATSTPTPSATPSPTPRPAKPFQPVVSCVPMNGVLAVSGATAWAIQDCTATWETENVSEVQANATTTTPGWSIIAVNSGALGDQAQLDAAIGTLALADDTPGDGKFLGAHFYLGSRLSCTAAASADIQLALTATSTEPVSEDDAGNPLPGADGSPAQLGPQHVETATTALQVGSQAATDPTIAITGFSFSQVDQPASEESTGTITLAYTDAPSACGWQVQIALSDFTSDLATVPVSTMTLSGVTGPGTPTSSLADGVISIILAPDPAAPASGTLTITTKVTFPDSVPPGGYRIAATVQATRLQ